LQQNRCIQMVLLDKFNYLIDSLQSIISKVKKLLR
jgi:hypothetical protein